MDHVLKKYCPRIEFDSYEDFAENFTIEVPEAFNFGFDVVDEWANHAHSSCIVHGVYGIFGSRLVSSLDEFFPHAVGRLDARFPR